MNWYNISILFQNHRETNAVTFLSDSNIALRRRNVGKIMIYDREIGVGESTGLCARIDLWGESTVNSIVYFERNVLHGYISFWERGGCSRRGG